MIGTLEKIAAAERAGGLFSRGYHYAGAADFCLREGTNFEAPTSPHPYMQGAPRACFGNAIALAAVHGLVYVEGYAENAVVPGLPIHHAWNLDGGRVVDVTWGAYSGGACVRPIGTAYLGVAFAVERADEATWDGDASVLDDLHRGWPLYRHKWCGETDWTWFRSPRLDALRSYRDGPAGARRLRALLEETA